jgi:sigma-E factor negative regulatory protein RseC
MIIEKAQVIAVEGQYVLVQTERQSACTGCSVNRSCGSSILSRLLGSRFLQMKVRNRVAAELGDTVNIGIQESGLLKSALLVYAWPLSCVPLFIGLGSMISGSRPGDGPAIVLALLGLAFGVFSAKMLSARLMNNPAFHPVVLSVERRCGQSTAALAS